MTTSIKVKAEFPQPQAQDFIQKGYILLHEGQPLAALKAWEKAENLYKSQNNKEGVFESLTNQSLAFQALGLPRRACLVLTKALNLEDLICNATETEVQHLKLLQGILQNQPKKSITLTAIINLGNTLRTLNKLEESQVVLESVSSAQPSEQLLMSLANTQLSFYERAIIQYNNTSKIASQEEILETIKYHSQTALDIYKKLRFSSEKSTVLKAKLNQLSLLIGLYTFSQEFQIYQRDILDIVQQTVELNFDIFSGIDTVYTRLKFVDSLLKFIQINNGDTLNNKKFLDISFKYSQESLQAAKRLDNSRGISYAYGYLGKVYSLLELNAESISSFKKAIAVAQSQQYWDIAYQWQHSLGIKYRDIGNFNEAKKQYNAAINNIDILRHRLISYPEEEYNFLEKIEPIYIDYINLLASTPNFSKEAIIEISNQLQTIQLENIVQCHKNNNFFNLNKSHPEVPVIHLINLGNRVDVFLQFQNKSYHHSPNYQEIKHYLSSLTKNLQDENYSNSDESRTIIYSQALYKLLIAPIEQHLPHDGTLSFVLGDEFQNLPMSLLHDGNDYLYKRYSIAISSGLDMPAPRSLNFNQANALLAGISEESPSAKSSNAPKKLSLLPEVEIELSTIKKYLNKSSVLLNKEFTSINLQQKLNDDHSDYSIVHISTHGQFSSQPRKTMILAWDKPLTINDMSNLLKDRKDNSIDLLVLSACEAAKGDRRSVLGIAGVAFQAHTRSTLASLWLVDANSTTLLMADFYKNLKEGKSKAEALRQAQINLSSQPEYSHPYYWAPFILVGSWL